MSTAWRRRTRVALAALAATLCAALAWQGQTPGAAGRRSVRAELGQLSPWPDTFPGCSRAHAGRPLEALEREAHGSWRRARFDAQEAPAAVLRLAVARACASQRGDLSAVDRLSVLHERWSGVVERRLDRETLRLELALRAGDAQAVGGHAERVAALLSSADGEAVQRARGYLGRLMRRARAARSRGRREEE